VTSIAAVDSVNPTMLLALADSEIVDVALSAVEFVVDTLAVVSTVSLTGVDSTTDDVVTSTTETFSVEIDGVTATIVDSVAFNSTVTLADSVEVAISIVAFWPKDVATSMDTFSVEIDDVTPAAVVDSVAFNSTVELDDSVEVAFNSTVDSVGVAISIVAFWPEDVVVTSAMEAFNTVSDVVVVDSIDTLANSVEPTISTVTLDVAIVVTFSTPVVVLSASVEILSAVALANSVEELFAEMGISVVTLRSTVALADSVKDVVAFSMPADVVASTEAFKIEADVSLSNAITVAFDSAVELTDSTVAFSDTAVELTDSVVAFSETKLVVVSTDEFSTAVGVDTLASSVELMISISLVTLSVAIVLTSSPAAVDAPPSTLVELTTTAFVALRNSVAALSSVASEMPL